MKKITLLAALFVSVASFAQFAGTSFEEPGLFGVQYVDTGDPSVAHDLVNNTDEPFVDFAATGSEIGYDASYAPYDTPDVGLTDGDFVGVTDFQPTADDPYTDGTQGYQISDVDGNYTLEFDAVDLTGTTAATVSIDYFLAETGYEGDGTLNESGSDRLRIYVRDLTNSTEIDILDTTGSDINDLSIEGTWITGTAVVLPNTEVQLVIEARTNAGAEAFFFDNVVVDASFGINDQTASNFAIYPNPATDNINITSSLNGDKMVAIFDVLGKQVMNSVVTGERLNIEALNSGVYIVKITQGNVSETQKLVVR